MDIELTEGIDAFYVDGINVREIYLGSDKVYGFPQSGILLDAGVVDSGQFAYDFSTYYVTQIAYANYSTSMNITIKDYIKHSRLLTYDYYSKTTANLYL